VQRVVAFALGGAGDDRVTGGQGDDIVLGGAGDDVLAGGSGYDRVRAGSGDDVLAATADGDRLDGGAGEDKAVYSGAWQDYRVEQVDGGLQVRSVEGGPVGDRLDNIETITFDNQRFQVEQLQQLLDIVNEPDEEERQRKLSGVNASGSTSLGDAAALGLIGAFASQAAADPQGLLAAVDTDGDATADGLQRVAPDPAAVIDAAPSDTGAIPPDVAPPSVPDGFLGDGDSGAGGPTDGPPTAPTAPTVPDELVQPLPSAPGVGPAERDAVADEADDEADSDGEVARSSEPDEPAPPEGFDGRVGLYGSLGDDRLVDDVGVDYLVGYSGDDVLIGRGGDDFLYGGDGDDRLRPGVGANGVRGGAGVDTLSYREAASAVEVDLEAATARIAGTGGDELGGVESAVGSEFADQLAASAEGSALEGLAGDDHLVGRAGSDTLLGGAGADTITADAGADRVFGGDGADRVFGARGEDELIGGGGDDQLRGAMGADRLAGSAGSDALEGGAGPDELTGGTGEDTVAGGEGADALYGEAGSDRLSGAAGADTLAGGTGNDALAGGVDADELFGEAGSDHLKGGTGADVLAAGTGDDTLEGGDGRDQLAGDAGADELFGGGGGDRLRGGDHADTLNGGDGADDLAGDAGNDVLRGGLLGDALAGGRGDDRLAGGAGADELTGDAGSDALTGAAGSDRLEGGAGADELIGGDGSDELAGGEGADTLAGQAGSDQLRGGAGADALTGGAGQDALNGGAGRDELAGNGGEDRLTGGTSADHLDGGAAADILIGGAGADTVLGRGGDDTNIAGGVGTDTLRGEAGADALFGGDDADTLHGGTGDDELLGGAGADTIIGGVGSDILAGGAGDDQLRVGGEDNLAFVQGGTGRDTVSFARTQGASLDLAAMSSVEVAEGSAKDDTFAGTFDLDRIAGGDGTDHVRFAELSVFDVDHFAWSDDRSEVTLERGDQSVTVAAETVEFAEGNVKLGGEDNAPFFAKDTIGFTGAREDTAFELTSADIQVDALDVDPGDDASDFQWSSIGGVDIGLTRALSAAYHGNGTLDAASGSWRTDAYGTVYGRETIDYGPRPDDTHRGTSGDDALFGQILTQYGGFATVGPREHPDSDELFGRAGDDILVGGRRGDLLHGGAGQDTADYSRSDNNVDIDLAASQAAGGTATGDTLTSIEHVLGTSHDDQLAGDGRDNVLDGGRGDDRLIGERGDDTLAGGRGDRDVAVFRGERSEYDMTAGGDSLIVDHGDGRDGRDTVTGVQELRFADQRVFIGEANAGNGTVSVHDNTFTFMPREDFNSLRGDKGQFSLATGRDTGNGRGITAEVAVDPVNDAPGLLPGEANYGGELSSDSYRVGTVDRDNPSSARDVRYAQVEPTNGRVLGADEEDGSDLQYELVQGPSFGRITNFSDDGSFTYSLNWGANAGSSTQETITTCRNTGRGGNQQCETETRYIADPPAYPNANAENAKYVSFEVEITDSGENAEKDDSESVVRNVDIDNNVPDGDGKKPLALDLDGDGHEFRDIDDSDIEADINDDGALDRMAWIGGDDGLLTVDRNEDGQVSNFDEISFVDDHPEARTDLDGLRLAFDSNEDRVLDQSDQRWSDFGVWQDANGDGDQDSGEHSSLADAGIASIDLHSDEVIREDGDVRSFGEGTYTQSDGSTGSFSDVAFAYETAGGDSDQEGQEGASNGRASSGNGTTATRTDASGDAGSGAGAGRVKQAEQSVGQGTEDSSTVTAATAQRGEERAETADEAGDSGVSAREAETAPPRTSSEEGVANKSPSTEVDELAAVLAQRATETASPRTSSEEGVAKTSPSTGVDELAAVLAQRATEAANTPMGSERPADDAKGDPGIAATAAGESEALEMASVAG